MRTLESGGKGDRVTQEAEAKVEAGFSLDRVERPHDRAAVPPLMVVRFCVFAIATKPPHPGRIDLTHVGVPHEEDPTQRRLGMRGLSLERCRGFSRCFGLGSLCGVL